jgi:hypothetical protein
MTTFSSRCVAGGGDRAITSTIATPSGSSSTATGVDANRDERLGACRVANAIEPNAAMRARIGRAQRQAGVLDEAEQARVLEQRPFALPGGADFVGADVLVLAGVGRDLDHASTWRR